MVKDLELKVNDDKHFIIQIVSELFAYEINNQALELGLEKLNIEDVYNSIHTQINFENYKENIYEVTSKILYDDYRIDMKLK